MKYIKLDPKEIKSVEITYDTNVAGLKLKKVKTGFLWKKTKYIIEDEESNKYNLERLKEGIYSVKDPFIVYNHLLLEEEKTVVGIDFEKEKIFGVSIIKVNYLDRFPAIYYFDHNSFDSFEENSRLVVENLLTKGNITWLKIEE